MVVRNRTGARARYTDAAAVYMRTNALGGGVAVDVLIYDDTLRRGRVINYTGWTMTATTTKKQKREIKRVPATNATRTIAVPPLRAGI